jgi:four helix bundle protein
MKLLSCKDLDVWKKSMDLVDEVYLVTRQFPKSETYALASQMQRAAIAIPSNIAEGSRRNHTLEFIQFLGIANASAAELETQVLISKRLYNKFDYTKIETTLLGIQKMLYKLILSLRSRNYSLTTKH